MKLVFYEGKVMDKEIADVFPLIQVLRQKQEYIHRLETEDVIDFFDHVAETWSNSKELEKGIGSTLKHFVRFISKENTIAMLNFALRGDYHILDKFINFELFNQKYCYHCQPRGLTAHWLAGNVPLLGFYSLIQAMLTKNVSLIKASSRAYEELVLLLDSITKIDTAQIKGEELLSTVAVILIDHDDIKNQSILSENADVRVAWGGKEAVEAITLLKKSIFCEDITFGPKYSYGVVDKEALADYKNITLKLAMDICTFDQYACSSPHTIFVQESENINFEQFAEELARKLDFVTKKFLPKGQEDSKKKMDILSVRAKYGMLGKVFHSDNTDWTVVCTTEEGLHDACFSRVVFVKPVKDLNTLQKYNDKHKQTLGCALWNKDREQLVDEITVHGIDRCPAFGDLTLYESPWDGMFAIDRMVRWVSFCKKG